MKRQRSAILIPLILVLAVICGGLESRAQSKSTFSTTPSPSAECSAGQRRCVTQAEREEAAKRAAAKRAAVSPATKQAVSPKFGSRIAAPLAVGPAAVQIFPLLTGCNAAMNPGGVPDYMSGCVSNYATSPLPVVNNLGAYVSGGMRKFVDALPAIPVAVPDTLTYPGTDYYEISLQEYQQKMHSDLLNKTTLRGYVQTNRPAGAPAVSIQYGGPIIVAQRDKPVRVKFTNNLPIGTGGDLFIPVDTTVMGSGMGPNGENYKQNRGSLHLHGGNTPWISDGTPHQWTTPATETTAYPKGVSTRDVPDMTPTKAGEMTFYYTNQQSARLMFYHDHSYGITRLNVYAGEAAGYLLSDPVEQTLVTGGTITPPVGAGGAVTVPAGTIPVDQIALIIQDKTFVPGPDQLASQDPTWKWGPTSGLWFPHVYMPNQDPSDVSGVDAMGRWDWGPWFWPAMDPSTLKVGEVLCPSAANPSQVCPGTPNPSLVPEAFMDTPVVNGMAYPYLQVAPKAYRLRILNASNDRTLNLSLYQASDGSAANLVCPGLPTVPPAGSPASQPSTCTEVKFIPAPDGVAGQGPIPDPLTKGPNMIQIGTEGGLLPAPVTLTNTPISYNYNRRDIVVLNVADKNLWMGPAVRADVIVDFSAFAGKTLILYNDSGAPVPAFDTRYDYYTGDTDQTTSGGAPTTIAGYGPNTRTIMQIQVSAGTPVPYSAASLAALTTGLPAAFAASQDKPIIPEAAYGPAYGTTYPNTYSRIQDTSVFTGSLTAITFTPGSGYTTAPTVTITGPGGTGTTATAVATVDAVKKIVTGITLTSPGTGYTFIPQVTLAGGGGTGATAAAVGIPMLRKVIQELFELDYGRMNATLGTELPFTTFNNQTTIPLGYIDPPTENFGNGETQIWKITHNGVDTHAIHFHLFNVQVINRVGWDGAIRPPEANDLGWKETVMMSPLEDVIVALKPVKQNLPWPLPDSIRLQDVTKLKDAPINVIDSVGGNPAIVQNENINFGQEYVWHCHLLGHEENDMMRPMIFQVAPEAPSLLAVSGTAGSTVLLFNDNSASETGFIIQRSTDQTFLSGVTPINAPANLGYSTPKLAAVVSVPDTTALANTTYFYRAQAINNAAFNGYIAVGTTNVMQSQTLSSGWSNTATAGGSATAAPVMISPVTGSTLTGNTTVFTWTTGIGVTHMILSVGSALGTNNLFYYDGAASLTPSVTATGLPTNGSTIYVRLYAFVNGAWLSSDYTYKTAAPQITAMISPVAGSALPGSTTVFTWTPGVGVTHMVLSVGSAVGSNNLFYYDGAASLTPSVTATGLPTNGSSVYVRLYALVNGAWLFTDYTYTAAVAKTTAMISPVPGSYLTGSTTPFTWTTGVGVTHMVLSVGSTVGSSNLFYYDGAASLTPSMTATGLPTNGSPIYVRLYAFANGAWLFTDYTYTAAVPQKTAMISPIPATLLAGSTTTFTWTPGTGVTHMVLSIGSTVGTNNLFYYDGGTSLTPSVTATGLPTNGSTIYVRLYAFVNGAWLFTDYTYVT